MIYAISLIILGMLAASSIIVSKKPDAEKYLKQLAQYQGWIGLVFAIWGVWGIISSIIHINLLSSNPIMWSTQMLTSFLEAALGFILGYGMINSMLLSKNPEAEEKGKELLKRLQPFQSTLGIVAIVLGILALVATFIV